MSLQVQWRRGTTAQNDAFTGAVAEITVNTDNGSLRVHDGVTAGGVELARSSQIDSLLVKDVAGAGDVTLSAGEAANSNHEYTGVLTGNINVVVPAVSHNFTAENLTSGAFTLTVKTAAGTGILIPQGKALQLYCNGPNVEDSNSAKANLSGAQYTGTIGIGIAPLAARGMRVGTTLSGSVNQYGFVSEATFGSGATTSAQGFNASLTTAAAAFTCATAIGYRAQSLALGAGSAVTDYYAFYGDAETNATNNYGAYIADNSAFGSLPTSTVKLAVVGDSTGTTASFGAYNSTLAALLVARNDGLISTGVQANSPYNNTTASAANVFVNSNGQLQRSTSSLRFKTNVEDMQQQYAEALVYQSRPVFYRSTCETDNPAHSYWGFIAEELALLDPRVVHWGKSLHTVVKDIQRERYILDAAGNKTFDETGTVIKETYVEQVTVTETDETSPLIPDGVAYERFVVALVKVVQQQRDQIAALETRLTAAGL